MSYGKMNTTIDLISPEGTTDSAGFAVSGDVVLATVRAYHEARHGSRKWANRAAFSKATDLFRFRVISGLEVTPALVIVCDEGRFSITSVEDVSGRGMYVEALATKLVGAHG